MAFDDVTPGDLAREFGIDAKSIRVFLRATYGKLNRSVETRWKLTPDQAGTVRRHLRRVVVSDRTTSDEHYVLNLCDEVVGSRGLRQHRFEWLVGDVSPTTGRAARLPVDSYWPEQRLVVEFRESQHFESTPFFDKPDRLTVSGVHRGEQRRRYDALRDSQIPAQGLRLVVIRTDDFTTRGKKILRTLTDIEVVRGLVQPTGT